MITIKEFGDRIFDTKEDVFTALRENKQSLIATKKIQTKEADSFYYVPQIQNTKCETIKAESIDISSIDKIQATIIVNTTNILDSHSDVHIKGIWKKSASEVKNMLHLQEHKMMFDKIISDDVAVSIPTVSWKSLGFNYKGDTEALTFISEIHKDRNEYMFNQYAKGYVKEHSVGMRYVKMELAINSDSKWDEEEKATWDKYIDQIVNRDKAEEQGYFWAILEAKVIEGSAVVRGSNFATPTISIEAVENTSKIEPTEVTQIKTNRRVLI